MELVLAIAAVLGGIAALIAICRAVAAWRAKPRTLASQPSGPIASPVPSSSPAPAPTPGATTTGLPHLPPRNLTFTGREEELRRLRESLVEGGSAALTQAIVGLGGVGKTQLAVEYAHRHRDDYEVIWWVRAEEPAQLAEDFGALARALDLPEKDEQDQRVVTQAVCRWLESNDGWLLVFDNAPKAESLKDHRPGGGRGHAIITSRDPDWAGVAKPLPVEVWPPEESLEFLGKRLGRTDEVAAELAEELGHLPLALAQAAAYIETSGISLEEYLKLYRERRTELWGDQPPPHDYSHTVTTTWDMAMKNLGQEEAAAAGLLNLIAFLAPEDIPRDLFAKGAEHLPDSLAEMVKDELALNRAIAALRHYSLISADDESLSVHRLVQAVTRDRLEDAERKTWCSAAVSVADAALPIFPHDAYDAECAQTYDALSPHALAAAAHAESLHVGAAAAGRALSQVGFYLHIRAQFDQAKVCFERALAIVVKTHGKEAPQVAAVVNNLGEVLRAMGDLAGAKERFERALAMGEKTYGPDHPDVATDVNNLGSVLRAMGDLEGAKEHYERALAIDEKVYGPDHPSVAIDVNNLGSVLFSSGDLDGALAYAKRGLDTMEKVYGPEHPDVAQCVSNVGDVLATMGRRDGARRQYERALAIFRTFLGEDHPQTQLVRRNLEGLDKAEGE